MFQVSLSCCPFSVVCHIQWHRAVTEYPELCVPVHFVLPGCYRGDVPVGMYEVCCRN